MEQSCEKKKGLIKTSTNKWYNSRLFAMLIKSWGGQGGGKRLLISLFKKERNKQQTTSESGYFSWTSTDTDFCFWWRFYLIVQSPKITRDRINPDCKTRSNFIPQIRTNLKSQIDFMSFFKVIHKIHIFGINNYNREMTAVLVNLVSWPLIFQRRKKVHPMLVLRTSCACLK